MPGISKNPGARAWYHMGLILAAFQVNNTARSEAVISRQVRGYRAHTHMYMLALLEKRLVERLPNPRRRRAWLFRATEAGLARDVGDLTERVTADACHLLRPDAPAYDSRALARALGMQPPRLNIQARTVAFK